MILQPPPISNARRGQILSLRQKIPKLVQLTPDESQFSIKLVNANYQPLCDIIVTLPPGFPENSKPDIRTSPVVAHEWVDKGTGLIIGHPTINNWSWNLQPDLGRVVTEVIQHFATRPPQASPIVTQHQVQQQQQQSIGGRGGTVPNHVFTSQGNNDQTTVSDHKNISGNSTSRGTTGARVQIQIPPGTLSEALKNFDEAKLLSLRENKQALSDFLHYLEIVVEKKKVASELLENNARTAQEGLDIGEQELKELREKILKNGEVIEGRRNEVKLLCGKMEGLKEKYSVDKMIVKLSQKIKDAEQEVEEVSSKLLEEAENEVDPVKKKAVYLKFKKKLIDCRKTMHRLKAKLSRLQVSAKIQNV